MTTPRFIILVPDGEGAPKRPIALTPIAAEDWLKLDHNVTGIPTCYYEEASAFGFWPQPAEGVEIYELYEAKR